MSSPDFVSPAYHARSLGDVVPAAVHAMGLGALVGPAPSDLVLPEASAYVVFLIDGLGANLLSRHAQDAPFLAELLAEQRPGTSGVPSTTATSLTSLGTGLTPGEHGLVGFTSRIPGTDDLIQALAWNDTVAPEVWQPHPTVFEQLGRAGVETSVINKPAFQTSGLTRVGYRGGAFVGAATVDQRIEQVRQQATHRSSLTYVYDSDLDGTGHKFGVGSWQWQQALAEVDEEAERMREELPPEVKLLVVADHGMVDCPPDRHIDIDADRSLRAGVRLLGGEARFRHLYTQPGATDDVLATWRDILGDRGTVLTRDDAFAAGWFGTPTHTVEPRIGEVVVAMHDNHALVSSVDFPGEMTMVGYHGSLTPDEMLIPILAC